MKEKTPLITIITPTYNRADYLEETIESVLSQSYKNIEYFILDDGSTDNTIEVLKKFKNKTIVETHTSIGETETVNKGLRMAKGEFICVVNSDDPILPDAITKLVFALMAEPEALVAYPDWVEIDSNSKPIKEMRLPDYHLENMLSEFNVAMGPGTLFRRSVLKDYGFRDPKRKYTGDLEFWFRLAAHGELVHVSKVLATHRTHPDSISLNDKSSKMAEELISMVKSLFAAGNVPANIQYKKQVFSQVYYTATFYCPREPFKRIQYFILSFLYNPRRFLLQMHHSPKHYIRQSIVKSLRFVLPESTYCSIRSWWRRLRKINS